MPVALVLAFTAVTIPILGVTIPTVPGIDLGIEGIWWAYSFGMVASFAVAVVWFRLGTWREGIVDDGADAGRPNMANAKPRLTLSSSTTDRCKSFPMRPRPVQ